MRRYPGRKKTYTPEQTDRYLSQRARWARGMAIAPSRIELISETVEDITDEAKRVTTKVYHHIYISSRHGLEWTVPVTKIETKYGAF
jgi:hypothetical protein